MSTHPYAYVEAQSNFPGRLGNSACKCAHHGAHSLPHRYVEAQSNFPNSLGPFSINTNPEMSVTLEHTETHITYRVTEGLRVTDVLPIDAQHGRCSPIAPLPAGWPGAPEKAVALCWAHPMEHFHETLRRDHTTKWQLAFLSLSAYGPLQFALYGGWLLLDAHGAVICVQSISIESGPESECELIPLIASSPSPSDCL